MKRQKPKFKVGQVVQIPSNEYPDRPHFGRIVSLTAVDGRIQLEFWDADNGCAWEWDYKPCELRPLTTKERGN